MQRKTIITFIIITFIININITIPYSFRNSQLMLAYLTLSATSATSYQPNIYTFTHLHIST